MSSRALRSERESRLCAQKALCCVALQLDDSVIMFLTPIDA